MLKVNEIFLSIQGESSFAGLPCIFIRLSGCNLRCKYCDTKYAYNDFTPMSIEEILSSIEAFQVSITEITGGEPLLQRDTPALIKALIQRGYQVLLETNGSMDISLVEEGCVRIVDVKCPSSGEAEKNRWENMRHLRPGDELKFVMADRQDYEFAKEVLERFRLMDLKFLKIHFSPVFGALEAKDLARWILEDRLLVRLHLQLHKIIWPSGEPRIL